MRIKEIVTSLVHDYGTRCPFELSEKLGIEVVLEPLESLNVLGIYMKVEEQKVIVCNSFLALSSQIVIISHELGHAVQHDGMSMFFLQDNTLFPSGKLETQANRFAAELLIPDSMLEQYAGYSIEEIASIENIHPKLFTYKNFNPLIADL